MIRLQGRAAIQFEQHEFFECGAPNRVFSIINPQAFRGVGSDGDPDDVYYVVEGHISTPGPIGSVGVTNGLLMAKKVTAMKGARLACLDKVRTN